MQKVKSLWVSSCLKNLLILPPPEPSCPSQYHPGSLLDGGQAWKEAEECFPQGPLLCFPGPTSILWGCKSHFPLCQEPDFREAEWWELSRGQDRVTTDGKRLWLPLDGGCSWSPRGGSGLDYSLERREGMLFLGSRETLATEWGWHSLCESCLRLWRYV